MKCPECGEDLRQLLPILIDMPVGRKITKAQFRKRDVEIIAAHWSKRVIYCPNPACDRVARVPTEEEADAILLESSE